MRESNYDEEILEVETIDETIDKVETKHAKWIKKESKLEDDIEATEDLEDIELDENDSDYKDMKLALNFIDVENKIVIDREQEDKDVDLYQKTKNKDLLGKLYSNRIPTLQFWANKNFYPGLTTSVEDLFGDLSIVFIKAVEKYNKGRGSFNTCLFTFLLNRIKNMKNSQHAKKRISEGYDGPLSSMVLSLDYDYNDKDGSNLSLKDLIPEDEKHLDENISFNEVVSILSKGDPTLRDFFKKLGEGHSLTSLIKEYKKRIGEIYIDLNQYDTLKRRKNKNLVKKILKDRQIFNEDFILEDYSLGCLKIKYVVELKKTPEFALITKAIRDIKTHKEYYISKLKGE